MFDWHLFNYTDFNKINLDWVTDCLKALLGGSTNQILSKKSDNDFDFIWIDNTGGSGGTTDYNALSNKPSINGSTLQGNKTAAQLGLVGAEVGKQLSTNDYTNADKDKLDSIVFVTQSSTFAEVDTAYTAGKKVIFFNSGELFDVVEKPNNNTYRFVHVNSGGGVRTAVITSGGSWTLATATNPGSYIKYISQTLSASQQANARSNIGAVSTGDYNPDAKTAAMTQAVGKDSNGKLWTTPGGGGTPIYTYDTTDIALNDSAIPINTALTPGYYLLSVGVLWGEGSEQSAREYINGKSLGANDTSYFRRANGHYMSYNTWFIVDDDKISIIRRFDKSDYLVSDSAWGGGTPELSSATVAMSLRATALTSWGFVAATDQNAAEVHLRLWKL